MVRALALWAAVLLLIAALAATLAPSARTPDPPVFPAPRPAGAAAVAVVTAQLPSRTPVRAQLGDVVRLHVIAGQPGSADVQGLGLRAPVGPGSSGLLEFVADLPGQWVVRLHDGPAIGTLDVRG